MSSFHCEVKFVQVLSFSSVLSLMPPFEMFVIRFSPEPDIPSTKLIKSVLSDVFFKNLTNTDGQNNLQHLHATHKAFLQEINLKIAVKFVYTSKFCDIAAVWLG